MRVTWTELARRNTKVLNKGDIESLNDSKDKGGVRFADLDPEVQETAEFSLAKQREENNRLLNRSHDSSDDASEEEAFI